MNSKSSYPIITVALVLVRSWKRIPRSQRPTELWNTNRIADTLAREVGIPDACLMSCDRNAQEKAHLILNRTESRAKECSSIQALGGPPRKKEKPHGVNAPTILLKHGLSDIALVDPLAHNVLVVTESRPRLERIYRDLTQCRYPDVPYFDYGDILIARFQREDRAFHAFMDARHVRGLPRIVNQEVIASVPP